MTQNTKKVLLTVLNCIIVICNLLVSQLTGTDTTVPVISSAVALGVLVA